MYPIIKRMTEELDLSQKQADYAFTIVISELLNKVPLLEPLIEGIFSDDDSEKLSDKVDKMIFLFQQRKMQVFVHWTMPKQTMRIRAGRDDIL